MGIAVMILGASGSGKSASMRNFKKGEIGIFNVVGKPLPFRNNLPVINTDSYDKIERALKRGRYKSYVIDDSQYLLANEFISHAAETGYSKFTTMAVNFHHLITMVASLPPDCIVYFLHHTEADAFGQIKAKTIGKMLDEKVTVEGLFSIVLLCEPENDTYGFRTRGKIPAKAPIGMFEERIDNDLEFVNRKIRKYYGLESKGGMSSADSDG